MADPIAMRGVNRARNVAMLEGAGFRPAPWLPLREHHATLRPTLEITERLMALGALIAWASNDERANPTRALTAHIARSKLDTALTADEREVLSLDRAEAKRAYDDAISWHLDALWSLAWILGQEPAPSFDGRPMPPDVIRSLLPFAQRGLDASAEGFASRVSLRAASEAVLLEDLFYCAHNAAIRAAMGEPTAPRGFDPVENGRAILSRRHALTWSLSVGASWEQTELDT